MAARLPLIVIVGPTASGKTATAIAVAQKYDGEIICADSRTVYADMDIGTAKPSVQEQAGVPHWGLDLALPSQRYTAAQFKRYADAKIADIRQRGKLPILVGGTGLYVDAVVFGYDFPAPMSDEVRQVLEGMTQQELYKYCIKHNIELPEDDKNKRRLLRTINDPERDYHKRNVPIDNTIIVGIATEGEVLRQRIAARTEQMFEHGVVEEATKLGKKYGWQAEAMTSNVYRVIKSHLEGELTLVETKDKFTTRDWQLAKRQLTWFRRNPFIEWATLAEAEHFLSQALARRHSL